MNLNLIDSSAETSPVTGPSDPSLRSADSLSHPVAHQDLFDQLSQWTNVNFDFSEPASTAQLGYQAVQPTYPGLFDSAQHRLGSIKGKSYERGFSFNANTNPASYIDPNAVFAPIDPSLFNSEINTIIPSTQFPALPYPIETPVVAAPELMKSTSSAITKTKAPKKGKKVTPSSAVIAVEVASPAASITTPEADEIKNGDPDDKRRRNTLASARFRVKKKEREQAAARDLKEALDKVAVLEKEKDLLKRENDWLRGLITEKARPGALIMPQAVVQAQK